MGPTTDFMEFNSGPPPGNDNQGGDNGFFGGPKPSLIEKYLIEICRSAGVDFTPDQKILAEELFEQPPPTTDFMEFNSGPPLPSKGPVGTPQGGNSPHLARNQPYPPPYQPSQQLPVLPTLPDLPSVPPSFNASAPSTSQDDDNDDVDFDD